MAEQEMEQQGVDTSSSRDLEYVTQFLGFTPKSMSDGMYNAIRDYMFDCLTAVEDCLKKEFGTNLTSEHVQKAREMLYPAMEKVMDKAFDRFEAYLMTSIFHVPSNTVLPEDQVQLDQPVTATGEEKLMSDIHSLKQSIKSQKYVNSQLQQELKDMEEIKSQIKSTLQLLGSVQQFMHQGGVSELTESLVFLKSNIKRLKSEVKSLPSVQDDPLMDTAN